MAESNLAPVAANLGGELIDITPEEGDRGDSVIEDAAPAPAPAPAPVEEPPPATEPAAEEPAAEEAAAEEAPAPTPGQRSPIPYDRFREVNEAKKAEKARADKLEAELLALRASQQQAPQQQAPQAPAAPAYDFGTKEREYAELLLDGRTADAASLRAEINTQLLAQATKSVQEQSSQAATNTLNQTRMREQIDTIANDFATRFPVLEETHEDYREDVVADVQAYYSGALSRGVAPVKAFRDALEKMVTLHGLEDVTKAKAPATPAAQPRRDVKAAAARASAQPPPTSAAGQSSADSGAGEIDIENLTDAQLAALPPATLARLRGDSL